MSATLETAKTAYLDNADYLTAGSAAKALAFVAACNQLLVLLPTVSRFGQQGELQWSVQAVSERLASVEKWLAGQTGGAAAAAVRYSDFQDFRT